MNAKLLACGLLLASACAQTAPDAVAPVRASAPVPAISTQLDHPLPIESSAWQQLPPDHPAMERWQPAKRTETPQPGRDPLPAIGDEIAVDVQFGAGTPVKAMPDPEMPTRQRKRMNIDQLDASLQKASGGIGWVVNGKNQFVALAATLGKPDYADMTQEDLTPSALFQKFLGDASLSICGKLVAADAKATKDQRVFFVKAEPTAALPKDAAAVNQNLAYLLKRWHGRTLAPDSPEVAQWLFLLQSAQKVSTPAEGWQAVCVALATHPAFYTY